MLNTKFIAMKRACKNSTLKGMIKRSELHTIPLKSKNFNRMKKISLVLIFTCICFQMLFSNNIENGEPAQLKKGDWFTIEFDSHPEDYSTPQDSVDYHSLLGLKKLAFKCEVSDINDKLIKLNFKFERLFVVNEYGEYFDSYFSQDATFKSDDFQIEAAINLTNDSINFISADKDFDRYTYATFSREVDIQGNRASTTESSRSIPLIIMKSLLDTYLKDWQNNDYQIPLKSSGDIKLEGFNTYRILESNLQIEPNLQMVVNVPDSLTGENLEILETVLILSPDNTEKKLLKKRGNLGDNYLSLYLPEQKLLKLKCGAQEIKFIATPGDTLQINLDAVNSNLVSKYQGDQKYLSLLIKRPKYFQVNSQGLEKMNLTDSGLQFLNEETVQLINSLDSFKHELTATFYKKQLLSVYYSVAEGITNWCENNKIRANYSELSNLIAFQNIHPLYDYIIHPDYYNWYLWNVTYNSFRPGFESVSTNQWFTRNFNPIENYDIYDMLYWGYPKYFKLKNIVYSDLEDNGIKHAQENYDKFLKNCKYPPLLNEIKDAYAHFKKFEPGEPIAGLGLNFIKNLEYNKNNGKYKVVLFYDYMPEAEKKKWTNSISHAAEKLKDKIEFVVAFDVKKKGSFSEIEFPKADNFQITYISDSLNNLRKDISTLMMYPDLLVIISPDNKLVSRNQGRWDIDRAIQQYIETQNQPKSHENRKAMLLGALISLLGTGLLAWLIIKINNRRIKKRESARRKLSELELKAIRSQMNPHFIFNAMGSIQNLMNHGKTEKANLYLSSFAKLMRMVLSSSNKKLVSLSDELELIRLYLELEQLRVDFQFKVEVGESVNPETEEIPGMLLQPFVENAVIHGITPKGGGSIEIEISKAESNLVCSISDDGVGIDPTKTGNGNGLAMKFAEKRVNLLSEQLKTRMKLQVVNRSVSEGKSGTKVTLIIPVE